MTPALEIRGLSKRYDGHLAVDGLDLCVPRGRVFGLLGPNGAGKSSTLRMAMGILARDAGAVSILGRDPVVDRSVLRRVGYLPEERGLYKKMTALDAVVFFAHLKGVPPRESRPRAREWLQRMGLADWADKKISTLSKGMQQKVQFVATVLHDPDLLVLDEPFSGLDPLNQDALRDTIRDARRAGRTVLFSTHVMEHAEQICDDVAIVARGRVLLGGTVAEVRRAGAGRRWRLEFDPDNAAVAELVRSPQWVSRAVADGTGYDVDVVDGVGPMAWLDAVRATGAPVVRFERALPTLHDIFVARVGAPSDTPRASADA